MSPAAQAAARVDLLLRERARGHEAGCATVRGDGSRKLVILDVSLDSPDVDSRADARRRRRSLFVVDYASGTITKLRTSDMKPLQTVDACYHPIGITYDRSTRRVWLACYTGSIRVYNDW